MNSFHFEGRLASAPEITNHASGTLCRIRLIRNQSRGKDQETGERREEEQVAIPFTVWGASGEALAKHSFVGDQLIVRASVHNNDYIPKNGTESDKVYGFSFRVEEWTWGAPGAVKRERLEQQRANQSHHSESNY